MKFIILALSLFATAAFADTTAAALAGSAAQSASLSGSASMASQGNAQNITFNSPANVTTNGTITHEIVGTSTVKTVPQVYAPPMGVTAPCRVALSGGISVIGVGVAAGGSVPDAPCNLRELSRTYQALGNVVKAGAVADGALALECLDDTVAKALGPLCPANAQQLPAPAPVAQVAENKCTKEVSQSGIVTTICK